MLNVEKIREELIKCNKEKGIKYKHISDKTFIEAHKLSKFKNNKKDLKSYELERLKKFLDQVNF